MLLREGRPFALGAIEATLLSCLGEPNRETYMYLLNKALYMIAQKDAIIVGRGAVYALRNSLAVRVIASMETRVKHMMARWGLSAGRNVRQTEADCKRLFPQARWRRLHLQLILFGRQHCPARGHDPTVCPICSRLSPVVPTPGKPACRY